MEHHQIEPEKSNQIKSVEPHRRIGSGNLHINAGGKVSQYRSCHGQHDAHGTAPSAPVLCQFIFVFLLDYADDIRLFQIPVRHHTDAAHRENQQQRRDPEKAPYQFQLHFLRIHHQHPEQIPQKRNKGNPSRDACKSGDRTQKQHFTEKPRRQLACRSPQRHENAHLPGFFPEKQAGSIKSKYDASKQSQPEDHIHLLSAVPALREDSLHGG